MQQALPPPQRYPPLAAPTQSPQQQQALPPPQSYKPLAAPTQSPQRRRRRALQQSSTPLATASTAMVPSSSLITVAGGQTDTSLAAAAAATVGQGDVVITPSREDYIPTDSDIERFKEVERKTKGYVVTMEQATPGFFPYYDTSTMPMRNIPEIRQWITTVILQHYTVVAVNVVWYLGVDDRANVATVACIIEYSEMKNYLATPVPERAEKKPRYDAGRYFDAWSGEWLQAALNNLRMDFAQGKLGRVLRLRTTGEPITLPNELVYVSMEWLYILAGILIFNDMHTDDDPITIMERNSMYKILSTSQAFVASVQKDLLGADIDLHPSDLFPAQNVEVAIKLITNNIFASRFWQSHLQHVSSVLSTTTGYAEWYDNIDTLYLAAVTDLFVSGKTIDSKIDAKQQASDAVSYKKKIITSVHDKTSATDPKAAAANEPQRLRFEED